MNQIKVSLSVLCALGWMGYETPTPNPEPPPPNSSRLLPNYLTQKIEHEN